MVITSPVAAYYKEGLNPVKLITSGEYVRAVKGGLGEAKTPANYAASILPAEKAQQQGFTQVLWLDEIEKKYVEEVGTMNIMFLIDEKLTFPSTAPPWEASPASRLWGAQRIGRRRCRKGRVAIDEVLAKAKDGSLQEVFGRDRGDNFTRRLDPPRRRDDHREEGRIGPFSQKLYDEITGIQYGGETRPLRLALSGRGIRNEGDGEPR